VYNICESNKLPWEKEAELSRARAIMGEKFQMKNVSDWSKYMKRWTEVLTDGDPKTWKENWKDGKPPEDHPAGQSEWRGGSFPSRMLKQMQADIDAFDPEKFVTLAERKTRTGEKDELIQGYVPNDAAMSAFEENFAIAMGIDPELTTSVNGRNNGFGNTGRDVESLRFEALDLQKDLKQRIGIYDVTSG